MNAVAKDHHKTPNPRTVFPPNLSAHMPPNTCVNKYPLENTPCLGQIALAGVTAKVPITQCSPDCLSSKAHTWILGANDLTNVLTMEAKYEKHHINCDVDAVHIAQKHFIPYVVGSELVD